MKVLRNEEGPYKWKQKVYCTGKGNGGGGCGALLEVSDEDIYHTFSYDMYGDCDSFYTIVCPLCGTETDLRLENHYVECSNNSKEKVLARYRGNKWE
jgi:hypothetical protein